MDNLQLTPKQKEFLKFISDYKFEQGIWPTYREIADEFGFKSPNSVTQNLQSLVKKGYLEKGDDNDYEIGSRFEAVPQEKSGIPIRGLIAAGGLQEAVDMDLGMITLDHIFPNLGKIFALRVSGMSMKESEIHDGDFVLLTNEEPKDGGIGAVLYNGETSLKKIFKSKNGLRLEPSNDNYNDIIIEPDESEEITVLGKYVGHINKSGLFKA
ncbi:MAG: transcriptional repressor LexA [Balneolales bacterium]